MSAHTHAEVIGLGHPVFEAVVVSDVALPRLEVCEPRLEDLHNARLLWLSILQTETTPHKLQSVHSSMTTESAFD